MRIGIDLTSLADNFSGIERYAANMTARLLEADQDDMFLLFFKDSVHDSLKDSLDLGNSEVRVIPSRGAGKLVFSQFLLPRALLREQLDLALFLAFPAPLLYEGKSISAVHDLSCLDCPQTMTLKSRMLWRQLDGKAVKSPYGVITVSEFSKSRIVGHYEVDPDDVVVTYCGVDDSLFNRERARSIGRDDLARKYGLPEEYVLSLSTIEPRKNLPFLIGAWASLCESEGFRRDLVLAGRRGWKTEGLLFGLPESLRERVHFTGFVDDADLPALYYNAALCVFPSIYEGFGLPPVEAACSGAKVLCSDIPCHREICGSSVSFYESGNEESLARAMKERMGGLPLGNEAPSYSWGGAASLLLGHIRRVEKRLTGE